MKIIKYFFEFTIIILLFIIFKIIGRKLSSNFGCLISKIFGPYFRSKKKIINNLKIVFPNLGDTEKNKIIKNMWCNFGRTFAEYVFQNKFKKDTSYVKIMGEKIIDNIIKKKTPTVFVAGHFANFEVIGIELNKKKLDFAVIYRQLNNFFLNPLMEYWRKKYISQNQIPKPISGKNNNGTRKFINAAKKRQNIIILVDQSVTQGIKVNFFNKKAFTTVMPAQLVLKFNYQIVPISIVRNNNHNFTMNIWSPIKLKKKENEYTITQKINNIIEKMILKNPGQWIWTHNRWKS